MTKRAFCLILALVLPVVLLCGCSSGKRLTLEEYETSLSDAYFEWSGADREKGQFEAEHIVDDNYKDDFDKVVQNRAALEQKIDKVELALDEFDKLGNPPAEFSKLHKKLKNAVAIEREWLEIQREQYRAETKEQFDELGEKEREFCEKNIYSGTVENRVIIPDVFVAIMEKIDAADSD